MQHEAKTITKTHVALIRTPKTGNKSTTATGIRQSNNMSNDCFAI